MTCDVVEVPLEAAVQAAPKNASVPNAWSTQSQPLVCVASRGIVVPLISTLMAFGSVGADGVRYVHFAMLSLIEESADVSSAGGLDVVVLGRRGARAPAGDRHVVEHLEELGALGAADADHVDRDLHGLEDVANDADAAHVVEAVELATRRGRAVARHRRAGAAL